MWTFSPICNLVGSVTIESRPCIVALPSLPKKTLKSHHYGLTPLGGPSHKPRSRFVVLIEIWVIFRLPLRLSDRFQKTSATLHVKETSLTASRLAGTSNSYMASWQLGKHTHSMSVSVPCTKDHVRVSVYGVVDASKLCVCVCVCVLSSAR
ncbi:hypothetical protein BD289DRAFT_30183 [Coniella lustricola]|uniref:Uncharacterized protein n=1 Tax=Coniella lustricola TaxID=2025994 RepID=A0A2T3A2U9_9PEZI|nr:hypothetical protein BD289DRAFT_30183 [Coniella lustricola]